MNFLQKNRRFISTRKFQISQEVRVGFLPLIHPENHLRNQLCDKLDFHLKTVKLNKQEQDDLTTQNEDTMDSTHKVQIPAYDIASTTIGFGNRDSKIITRAYKLRCNPSNAMIHKNPFTKISNSTKDINFVPTGLIQLVRPEAYSNTLNTQNNYLHNYMHFTQYNIIRAQMSIIREDLVKDKNIQRIVRTIQTNTKVNGL